MRAILLLCSVLSLSAASLRLRDGSELRADILTNVIIHTPYGSLSVAPNSIAQIHCADLDTLITTTGDRFSGYITAPVLSFKRFQIDHLKAAPIQLSRARFITLVNGDCLSGEFTLPSLTITNSAGPSVLTPEQIDSLWFTPGHSSIQIQLTDGKQAQARWTNQVLAINNAAAGPIELPRELFKTIHNRPGAVPPAIQQLLAAGTNSPAAVERERMAWIPPGNVLLGSPLDEAGRNSDEDPRTLVTISRGFWMGRFEVTQGEYAAVMGQNPSTFQGDTNRPVEKVSWHEAAEYCARLTERARRDGSLPPGHIYRLPTEAEWEYACRAGTTTRYSFGDDPDERELRDYAWFVGNSGWMTHPIGQLKPNPWGLYDMHGNVLEWCAGIWNEAYPGGHVTDYKGPPSGWLRVARGGSWLYGADLARSGNRDNYGSSNRCSDVGFRVVLAPPLSGQ